MPATLAIVFDFDDTLVPDSTTMLLEKHNIDPAEFWGVHLKSLVDDGFDPTLGFLKLFLDHIGPDKPLGTLSNQDLDAFGASLDAHYYPGIPDLFKDLLSIVAKYTDIGIEFYVVSGGLQAVIEGSSVIQEHCAAVYGCQLSDEGEAPTLHTIKRAVNFTEKTRFLFEINKGLQPSDTLEKPYLVNKNVPQENRRVPFKNMIYVGDGLTDIPCFSLLKQNGGICFGVFDPTDRSKAKRALLELLRPQRVISMHSPRYREDDDLGSLLRAAVSSMCNRIVVEQHTAEYQQA